MKKIRLEIIGIFSSPSDPTHFTLLLGEIEGYRKMPIMIGPLEAQSIALALQGGILERPNMHDLFKSALSQMSYVIERVTITDLQEEVFFAELLVRKGEHQFILDVRPSDAIALAARFSAPVYISEQVLSQVSDVVVTEMDIVRGAGLSRMDGRGDEQNGASDHLEQHTVKTLENLLALAIECEDYERAACIRDELKRRKE